MKSPQEVETGTSSRLGTSGASEEGSGASAQVFQKWLGRASGPRGNVADWPPAELGLC